MVGASAFISLLAVASTASAAVAPPAKWMGEVIKSGKTTYQCKCYSDDKCWPAPGQWNALNKSVDGRLQIARPPAAVCYNKVGDLQTYDAAKCAEITAKWTDEQTM